jgi:hypothetical protein
MREFELGYNVDPLEVVLNAYASKTEKDGVEILSCTVGAACVAVIALGVYAYVAAAHTVALTVLVVVAVGVETEVGVS